MKFKNVFTSKPLLFLEIAVFLFFGFNVGKEMYKKHSIGEEIGRLEQEIGKLESDKSELGALLAYVRTDTFVEQEARAKLNLASPGESLVLMPEADADPASTTQDLVEKEIAAAETPVESTVAEERKNNLTLWWKYFFEHSRLED